MRSAPGGSFVRELEQVCQQLRGALADALLHCRVEPGRPQELSRALKLDKSLAWKISKLATLEQCAEVVRFLPGAAGFDLALSALETAGAGAARLARVRATWESFRKFESAHAGDRATLEMLIAEATESGADSAERTRRQAFLGASGIWGVQCATRLACYALAPAADDPERVDIGLVGGLLGLCRLRHEISVPLFMFQAYRDGEAAAPQVELVDPGTLRPELALIREFCSPEEPALASHDRHGALRVELAPGPIGNTARTDIVFGRITRGFGSVRAAGPGEVGEHPTRVFLPTETLICDLLVHQQLSIAHRPKPFLYSRLAGGPEYPWSGVDADLLPLQERIESLGAAPPVVSCAAAPRYPEMVARLFARGGWDVNQFRGFRFAMRFPPIPTILVLRYDLLAPKA
jgi:hypothetical protein